MLRLDRRYFYSTDHYYCKYDRTPSIMIVSLQYKWLFKTFIHDLNWNFGVLFWTVFCARESKISMERIQELLLAHERAVQGKIESSDAKKEPKLNEKPADEDSNALELKNVTAAWPQTEEPVLKNLNLSVEKGALIGIIGQARDLRTLPQCLTDNF